MTTSCRLGTGGRVDGRIDMTHALLTAEEAAERLGVKRATLYTYVSRGWLTRASGKGRESRYLEADVERLRQRGVAHKGHGAAAADAMSWGAPVMDSAIT